MKHKKLLQVLVPLLILVLAAGLYLYKDNQTKQEAARQLNLAGDPAFVLQETSFDLATYQAHQLPLILDFGADDCVPCQVMRPHLEAAHQATLGRAVIKYFDVWKQPALAAGYPIRVVPSQVFYLADGSPWLPSEALLSAGLRFALYDHSDTGRHALTVHEGQLTQEDFQLILTDMGIAL